MTRASASALLAVLGAGVFLAGLELMVTAVALPTIIARPLVEQPRTRFSELRHASWIVNGYLLAYVVAMPLAGRLADVWGARRLFLAALGLFIVGSLVAGRAQSIDELIAGRIIQGVGGGILVPVGTAAASHLFEGHARPRALGIIGALTFLGMAAGPFLGAAILGGFDVERGAARARRRRRARDPRRSSRRPGGGSSTSTSRSGSSPCSSPGPRRAGWETPRRGGGIDVVGAVDLERRPRRPGCWRDRP